MTRKIAPSEQKAQAIAQWLKGQSDVQSGEELLSAFVRLATERVLQETLEQEQTEALGRSRYERQTTAQGYRNGYEEGTMKTAAGVFRVHLLHVRGLREPYRSTPHHPRLAAWARPRGAAPWRHSAGAGHARATASLGYTESSLEAEAHSPVTHAWRK